MEALGYSRAIAAAAVLFAGYLVLALIAGAAFGMGDVKLAAVLGLFLGYLGWPAVALATLAAFAGFAVVAGALLAARRVSGATLLPFGPAMLGAAVLAALI